MYIAPDFVGYAAHAGIVPFARVGTCAADYEAGTLAAASLPQRSIVVYKACLGVDVVLGEPGNEAGEVYGAAVAEVSAVAEVKSDKLVAWLEGMP